jgi:hypothetical protein
LVGLGPRRNAGGGSAISENQEHAPILQCTPDRGQVIGDRHAATGFEVPDRAVRYLRLARKVILRPIQPSARGPTLLW